MVLVFLYIFAVQYTMQRMVEFLKMYYTHCNGIKF